MKPTPALSTKLVAVITIASNLAFALPARAVTRESLGITRETQPAAPAAEYVFRNDPEEALMPVYVIGPVARPGLYHVPQRTDLVTLIALTGGTTEKADLGKVTIKKPAAKEVAEVDVEKVMRLSDLKGPTLGNNDVVLVGTKEPTIGPNTLAVVGIVSGLMGIIVSAILINKELGRK